MGELALPIGQVAFALLLLYFGGEWLVRGASALAARAGVSPLAIGLTVVAFGTSAPELAVSMDAALAGAGDIAVGNVVGSNIANIALILGLATALRPVAVHTPVLRLHLAILIGVSALLVVMLADRGILRLEGGLLLLGLFGYVTFTFKQARRASARTQEAFGPVAESALRGALGAAFIALALALLIGGGHLLVDAAIDLSRSLGVGEAVIGLTLVAVGTSLPELATSTIASLRGEGDIAVGNVVGSNLFNILGILGAASLMRPLDSGGITAVDLGLMLGLTCLAFALFAVRPRLGRIEGALLLIGYATYVRWLVAE